jgi:hypothetical protein
MRKMHGLGVVLEKDHPDGGGASSTGIERGLTWAEAKYSIKAPGTGTEFYKCVGNCGSIRGVLVSGRLMERPRRGVSNVWFRKIPTIHRRFGMDCWR